MSRGRYVVALVVAAVLGGCSLAPKYEAPAAPEVANFKESGDWALATPADSQSRGHWWEGFGEPKLDDLERQLEDSNPDLRAAVARFQEGTFLVGVQDPVAQKNRFAQNEAQLVVKTARELVKELGDIPRSRWLGSKRVA